LRCLVGADSLPAHRIDRWLDTLEQVFYRGLVEPSSETDPRVTDVA
jgi:hypothetical protein